MGGIDLAGEVVSSSDARYRPGEAVLVTGCGLSETHDGGYAEFARLKGDWVIPIAKGLDAFQVMSLGKPDPDPDGKLRVVFTGLMGTVPTPEINYEARISAAGPGGVGTSDPSNAFSFSAPPPCVYVVVPLIQTVAASAGNGSVSLTTTVPCSWTATSNASFITIASGGSGSGNGTVNFTVTANPTTSQRSGTLTVADRTITVNQAGMCAFTLSATSQPMPAAGGTSDVTISRCRFEHAGQRGVNIGGSTGLAYFRPKPQGYEAKNITVEDCTFIGSMSPVAFVGVDGATVRFNTFYRPGKWAFRILQETRGSDFVPCRNGRFTDNLIAFNSDALTTPVNIGDGTAPETFTLARNAWYSLDRPDRSRPRLPIDETGGVYGVKPAFVDAEAGDLRLKPDSRLKNIGVRPEQ